MRLITYNSAPAGPPRAGVRVGHRVLDIESASRVDGQPLPASMKALLVQGRGAMSRVQALAKAAQSAAGRFSAAMVEERAIRFLPPLADAGRFVGVEDNYAPRSGAKARIVDIDRSRLVGHNTKGIVRVDDPPCAQLVYVIGRPLEDADAEDAFEAAWGATLLGPAGALGPEIVTLDEIPHLDDLWITCAVNGVEVLRYNTHAQAWKPEEVLAQLSRDGGLGPGDLVATGAPAADIALSPGDTVECGIEGITTLRVVICAA